MGNRKYYGMMVTAAKDINPWVRMLRKPSRIR